MADLLRGNKMQVLSKKDFKLAISRFWVLFAAASFVLGVLKPSSFGRALLGQVEINFCIISDIRKN
jgi:hypothetical protein